MTHSDRIASVAWIQREYGGVKLGNVFDRRDQWLVGSHLEDRDSDVLVLKLAQGRKEARLKDPADCVRVDIRQTQDIADFKKQFRRLMLAAE